VLTLFNLSFNVPIQLKLDLVNELNNQTVCNFVDVYWQKIGFLDLINRVVLHFSLMIIFTIMIIYTIFTSRSRITNTNNSHANRTFRRVRC
jgi:hypothetical protein